MQGCKRDAFHHSEHSQSYHEYNTEQQYHPDEMKRLARRPDPRIIRELLNDNSPPDVFSNVYARNYTNLRVTDVAAQIGCSQDEKCRQERKNQYGCVVSRAWT